VKLYQFSKYANLREASKIEAEIYALRENINTPNTLPVLKKRVNAWFTLHQEILRGSGY